MISTHSDFCRLAVKWLKRHNSAGGPGCDVALRECRTGASGEVPDAIGFRSSDPMAGSTLIEVKVSRSDFLVDQKKAHRQGPGVGRWRYFMAPAGLIPVPDLPKGWGLLEVNSRGHVKVVAGAAVGFRAGYEKMQEFARQWRFDQVDLDREQYLLIRALANTGDPQVTLDRLREANNRAAGMARRIDEIGALFDLSPGLDGREVLRIAQLKLWQAGLISSRAAKKRKPLAQMASTIG